MHYWSATVQCDMTRDDLKKIAKLDFTAARVEADDMNIDFGIEPKESLMLKKMATLLLAQDK
jgi:hypothetical protein